MLLHCLILHDWIVTVRVCELLKLFNSMVSQRTSCGSKCGKADHPKPQLSPAPSPLKGSMAVLMQLGPLTAPAAGGFLADAFGWCLSYKGLGPDSQEYGMRIE